MDTKVVNKYKESYDVYIGRGSPWGNPFRVDVYGRDGCIERYRDYILKKLEDPLLRRQLEGLRGKRLGCFCKPQKCHGDILVEILNGEA